MEIFRLVSSNLPTLPKEIVGVLHLIALAGIAFAEDIEIISFKGNTIRVLGDFASTTVAIIGLLITFGVLATYSWWSKQLYNFFILTGWQAFGVISIEIPWILTNRSQRKMNFQLWGVVAIGVFLIVMPWMQ